MPPPIPPIPMPDENTSRLVVVGTPRSAIELSALGSATAAVAADV